MKNHRVFLFSLGLMLCLNFAVHAGVIPHYKLIQPQSPDKKSLIQELNNWRDEVEDFEDKNDRNTTMKLDLLYRLTFLVERRYDGSEASLIRILHFMGELDDQGEKNPEEKEFVQHLLEAIDKARERQEPLWLFIKTYVDDSEIMKPKSFDKFSQEREYINNFENERAKSLSDDEIEALRAQLGEPIENKEVKEPSIEQTETKAPEEAPKAE